MELMALVVRSWTVESKLRRSGSSRHAASYEFRSASSVFEFGSEVVRDGGRPLLLLPRSITSALKSGLKVDRGGRWRLLLLLLLFPSISWAFVFELVVVRGGGRRRLLLVRPILRLN